MAYQLDAPPVEAVQLSGAVGVDLGIKYLATTCDDSGNVVEYENPEPLKKHLKKLARLQRKLDRQQRMNNPDNYNEDGTPKIGVRWHKTANMKKTEAKVARLHQRIANIRIDATHKLTTSLASQYEIVGIEDLNIKGMMKNRKLARSLSDAALYEKRRQLEYKSGWYGGQTVPVDRWFASSKLCNGCGEINTELTLSVRVWTCASCGQLNLRDENAARNLRDESLRLAAI